MRRRVRTASGVGAAAITCIVAVAAGGDDTTTVGRDQGLAQFIGLGTLPGGSASLANAITNDGSIVVGYSTTSSGATEAFRWTETGGMVGLGDLPGGASMSIATSVSINGTVIVGYSASSQGPEEAFRWASGGGMTGLGDLPGGAFTSRATDVSANGSVVVGYGTPAADSILAFRWVAGQMTSLGDLPGGLLASRTMSVSGDGYTVTGWGNSGPLGVNEAFLWSPLSGMVGLGFIPGSLNPGTQGVALSFDGRTVVGSGWAGVGVEAFRWRPAFGYQPLGDLPGGTPQPFSAAFAISADATTIVGTGSTNLGAEAFIWTEAEGMQHLGQKLVALGADLPGWILKEARAVSVHGRVIAGVGTHNGTDEAWLARLESPCLADLNADGVVNVQDTLILLTIPYGLCVNCAYCPGDINGDCSVGTADLLAQFAVYGPCR